MITKAYIQKYDRRQVEREHKAVFDVLSSRGAACEWITQRQVLPGNYPWDAETFYAGDHDFMQAIFKKTGIPYAARNSYPDSLRGFMKRNVWESTVEQMQVACRKADYQACFIKPKTDTKLFTGFVLRPGKTLYRLDGLPRTLVLSCSELVSWTAEFRVFVNQSEIVGVKHYDGDVNAVINLEVVKEAISFLENSPERTAAYALDFGLLENGETALVEWNDGFALGAYGLDPEIYADLLVSRWETLNASSESAKST